MKRWITCALLGFTSATLAAADWPQFLGPTGDNVSPETGLADTFAKDGLPVLFSRRLGTGYAAPSVRGERLVVFQRASKLYKLEEGDTVQSVLDYLNGELAAFNAKERLTEAGLKAAVQATRRRGYIELPDAIAQHFDQECVDCLDARSGKLLWRHAYATTYEDPYGYNNGPRCAPLLTADRCYTFGAEGVLLCLELETGKPVWRRDTQKDFRVSPNFFGVGSTPVLEGGLLITMVGGGPNSGMVAFDARTGKTVWESVGQMTWDKVPMLGYPGEPLMEWNEEEKQASYASPVLATVHDRRVVFCLMRQGLVALDPKTGRQLFKRWFRARQNESVNASNPVVVGHHVFCSGAYYGVGSLLLSIKPDLSGYDEVWSTAKSRAEQNNPRLEETLGIHWMTPIHHEGRLYAFSGRNEPDARMRCVDFKSGRLLWDRDESWGRAEEDSRKYGRGSLILADGKLIALGETGRLGLFKPSPTRPIELAAYNVPQMTFPCWAGPVLSNKRLYLRCESRLLCLNFAR